MNRQKPNANSNGHLPHRRRRPITEVLPELLEARGLSYNDVERLTNGALSHSLLSKMLNEKAGPANPMLNTLIKLADVFDVSLGDLVDEQSGDRAGFRRSKYWRLYLIEKRLKQLKLRQIIQREIESLLELAEAADQWPKK